MIFGGLGMWPHVETFRHNNDTYRRDIGPYTVDVFNGFVTVYRSAWRDGSGRYDEERNVREVRFPNNPRRLPK